MRVIQKKISLNEFRSRIPSLVPALVDSWTVPSVFVDCNTGTDAVRFYDYGEAVVAAHERNISENELIYSAVQMTFDSEENRKMFPNGNYGLIPYTTKNETDKEKCFPKFEIPSEYVDEWNCEYLYFPQVMKYVDLYAKYSGITNVDECSASTNCCECSEYFRLGGNDVFGRMKEFLDDISCTGDFKEPYMYLDVMLTNSIDDLGEMTILSEEFVGGVNYGIKAENDDATTTNGTVVNNPYTYTDATSLTEDILSSTAVTMMLTGADGYTANRWKENEFDPSNWTDYSKYYQSISGSEFSSSEATSYTYSPIDGSVIYNTEQDALSTTGKVNGTSGIFLIDNTIYEVKRGYVSGVCANFAWYSPIENNGVIKTFTLKGKRYIISDDHTLAYDCDTTCDYDVKDSDYIYYNGKLIDVDSNGTITLSSITNGSLTMKTYQRLDGYFDVDGHRVYVSGNTLVVPNGFTYGNIASEDTCMTATQIFGTTDGLGFTGSTNGDTFTITYLVDEWFPLGVVSGYVDSKLELLRRTEVTVDDLGNPLPGYFSIPVENITTAVTGEAYYNRPYEGCHLEPLYEVGYTTGLHRTEDGSLYGNILTDILREEDDTLWTITYYIGAKLNEDREYVGGGVKYIDRISVNPSAMTTFYMADGTTFQLYYYDFMTNLKMVHNDDYDSDINMNMSYFEIPGRVAYVDRVNDEYVVAPVFRKEYDLATSTPQNLEGDIYIDRGISSAFEKHLKLQEIKNLESLEEYGNSWFSIENY